MKLSLQARTVLTHLRGESHITSWQAEGVYRIRRLASRIDEIVAAGFDVIKEEAKDATAQRYIRYSLSDAQKRADFPLHPKRVRESRLTLNLVRNTMNELGFHEDDIEDLITALKEKA
jgi:hypothetical protein